MALSGITHKILMLYNTHDTLALSSICRQTGYTPDLASYYMRQLLKCGYVIRGSRGKYTITPEGALQLNRTRADQIEVVRPRVIAVIVATYKSSHVVLRRKIQPYIGMTEWPAGAIELGETMDEVVRRLCERHFGWSGEAQLCGFLRQIERHEGHMLDDKLLAVHTVAIPDTATLNHSSDTGEIEVCDDIAKRVDGTPSLIDVYRFATQGTGLSYKENTYIR